MKLLRILAAGALSLVMLAVPGLVASAVAEKLVARWNDPTVPVGVTQLPAEPVPAPTPGA